MKAVGWAFLLVILSVVAGCKRVSDGNNTSLPVLDMERPLVNRFLIRLHGTVLLKK